jgi:hypothetical protein
VEDYPYVLQSIAGGVFLGTPHRGSNSQSKASVIATIASAMDLGEHSSVLKIVERDSESLSDLMYDFTRTVNIASIPLFCFFEQHKSDVAKILKPKGSFFGAYRVSVHSPHMFHTLMTEQEVVVDEQSACIDGFPKLGLAADHFQMHKYPSSENSNYRLVSHEIATLVNAAPSRVESRLART